VPVGAGANPAAERVGGFDLSTVPLPAKPVALRSRQLAIENQGTQFASRYQSQTLRPLISLVFVFPLILIYEMGAIYWGNAALRSGIDQWLDRMVATIGLGQQVILPLLTSAVLIIWHHRIRDHWKFRGRILPGMILESVCLGSILFCAASACNQLAGRMTDPLDQEAWSNFSSLLGQCDRWSATIASIGSGIYEELIFRLVLLLPAIEFLKRLGLPQVMSLVGGIFLVSLLFTSLHYNTINPAGGPIDAGSFIFRFTASIVFCFLFLFRGFGIAVGTHVAYDILAQL
jgi:membrane protease YdiL (CAAX protease family)